MKNNSGIWWNPDFPFPMSFPKRMLLATAIILIIVNLVAFYVHGTLLRQQLPLSFVLLVSLLEIAVIAIQFAVWVKPYGLKW